ncbi:Translin-associated factor X-interacting protein 1 N-terminal domain-containing protein [Plasmodiophora brassicae]
MSISRHSARWRSSSLQLLTRLREALCHQSGRVGADESRGDFPRAVLQSGLSVRLAFETLHQVGSLYGIGDVMGTVITILDAAVYTDEPADGQRRHTYASRAADAQTIADDSRQRAACLSGRNAELQGRLRDLETDLQRQRAEWAALTTSHAEQGQLVSGLQSRVRQLQLDLHRYQDENNRLAQEKTALERAVFEAELEAIEQRRVADDALAECQRVTVAHSQQQKLLSQVDFDPSRLTPAAQQSAAISEIATEDTMRNELETAYRQRDRLIAQLDDAVRERDAYLARYKKENQAKNMGLLRLAQVKDELGATADQLSDAMRCRTPRPDWSRRDDRYDLVYRVCGGADYVAGPAPSRDKVARILDTLQGRVRTMDDLNVTLHGQRDRTEGQAVDLHVSPLSNHRFLYAHPTDTPMVPSWLGVPVELGAVRVRNRNWTLKQTLKMARDVFAFRESQAPASTDPSLVLTDWIRSKVDDGSAVDGLDLAYNLADALDRYRWNSDCALLLEIIRVRIHWDALRVIATIEDALLAAMVQVDRRVRGRPSGKVPKGVFLEQCARVFPNKSEEARAMYVKALQKSGEAGFLVDYRSVLNRAAPRTDFLEMIRNQFVEEILDFQHGIRRGLQERRDPDGMVSFAGVVEVMAQVGCTLPVSDLSLAASRVLPHAPDTIAMTDRLPSHSFLHTLNRMYLAVPSGLFVALDASMTEGDSSVMPDRGVVKSASHQGLTKRRGSSRLMSVSKSASVLAAGAAPDTDDDDTASTVTEDGPRAPSDSGDLSDLDQRSPRSSVTDLVPGDGQQRALDRPACDSSL